MIYWAVNGQAHPTHSDWCSLHLHLTSIANNFLRKWSVIALTSSLIWPMSPRIHNVDSLAMKKACTCTYSIRSFKPNVHEELGPHQTLPIEAMVLIRPYLLRQRGIFMVDWRQHVVAKLKEYSIKVWTRSSKQWALQDFQAIPEKIWESGGSMLWL